MKRRPVALIALLLVLIGAGCRSVAAESEQGDVYYLDGFDRQDGMSASIDFTGRTLRVASDVLLLRPCGGQAPSIRCIDSDYFVLVPGNARNATWTAQGATFHASGTCSLSSLQAERPVSIVSSDQEHGEFRFYVGAGDELLGWTLRHAEGTDNYLKAGLGLGSCAVR